MVTRVLTGALKGAANLAGQGAKWVVGTTVRTVADATKWTLKKGANKIFDFATWTAKVALLTSVAITALTAVSAYLSPGITMSIVDTVGPMFGASAIEHGAGFTMRDVVGIQVQYTGEVLAFALKNGITLAVKSAVYTAQAVYEYIVKPAIQGYPEQPIEEMGRLLE